MPFLRNFLWKECNIQFLQI